MLHLVWFVALLDHFFVSSRLVKHSAMVHPCCFCQVCWIRNEISEGDSSMGEKGGRGKTTRPPYLNHLSKSQLQLQLTRRKQPIFKGNTNQWAQKWWCVWQKCLLVISRYASSQGLLHSVDNIVFPKERNESKEQWGAIGSCMKWPWMVLWK